MKLLNLKIGSSKSWLLYIEMDSMLCNFQVSVYPRVVQPENPNSYKARKREYFRLQRERKKARKEGIISPPEPQLVLASADDTVATNPVC